MPVPILQRQRALAAVGEIRIGGEKKGNKPGPKLSTFRLTSQQKELIDRAAELYGGAVTKWESPVGESWQVITNRADLPVMVVVGYSLTLLYELWEGASKCVRRCDGETEMLTDAPCICNAEGQDRCDIITRFMVLLPELGTSLGWRFRSTGEFAANELSGGVQIANELARGRVFVPATLRLTQRRSVATGTVHRYVVPVLDFDPRAEIGRPVDGELPALPAGYTPIEGAAGVKGAVNVKEGLAQVNRQELARNAGSAAPVGDPEFDEVEPVTAPVPDEPGVGPGGSASSSESVTEQATGSDLPVEAPPEPEPAEENPFADLEIQKEPAQEPIPTPPEEAEPVYINEAQRRRFHAMRRNRDISEARAKEILQKVTGQPSSAKIPLHLFDRVIAEIEAEATGQDQLL